MKLNGLLQKSPATLPILQATFGLERESLCISKTNHRVAQTKHPKCLGSRSFHPYIQTAYSKPQVAGISPIANSICQLLPLLTATLQTRLSKGI